MATGLLELLKLTPLFVGKPAQASATSPDASRPPLADDERTRDNAKRLTAILAKGYDEKIARTRAAMDAQPTPAVRAKLAAEIAAFSAARTEVDDLPPIDGARRMKKLDGDALALAVRAEGLLNQPVGAQPTVLAGAPPMLSASAAGPGGVQGEKGGDPSGKRTAAFEVRWAEDGDQFYTRVLSAITRDSAFRGVPSDQFNAASTAEPQTLMGLVAAFHRSYAMGHSDRKAGQKLKIQFSASYSKDAQMWSSSLTGKTMSLVDEAAAKPKPAQPAAAPASGATAMLARFAAEADRNGWAGANFTVKNDGRATVVTSMEKVGSEGGSPKGTPELTEAAAAKELEHFMSTVAEYKGNWDGHFFRDSKTGAMLFMKWSKGPDGPKAPPPPVPGRKLSQEEEFERETGEVYPQRINKKLHDVAAKKLEEANPFSLKNLPYTIASVVVPIGAMKLLMMDTSEMGIAIRFEWQLDEDIIQEANAARTAADAPKTPLPARDLAPGDVIYVPKYGQQRVVSVTPERIVTEPIKPPPPSPKNPDIKPIEGHTAEDVLAKNSPPKKHVFEGDETGGYHSKARDPNVNARQVDLLQNPRNGVYKIRAEFKKDGKVVEFQSADGKVSRTKDSTMFPDDMTENQIMEEVYTVMLKHKAAPLPAPNAKGLIVITGRSSKGFDINVWIAPKGDTQVLVTFFPKR